MSSVCAAPSARHAEKQRGVLRAFQRLGNGHRNAEENQGCGVVQRHHAKQRFCHRAFCAVLLNNHNGGCGRCGRRNGPQHQRKGQRLPCRRQGGHHKHHSKQAFKSGYDNGQKTHALEIAYFKLAANGKCNKAQRHAGNKPQRLYPLRAEQAQHRGPNDKPAHQEARDIGQLQKLDQAGKQQPCKQQRRHVEQWIHAKQM